MKNTRFAWLVSLCGFLLMTQPGCQQRGQSAADSPEIESLKAELQAIKHDLDQVKAQNQELLRLMTARNSPPAPAEPPSVNAPAPATPAASTPIVAAQPPAKAGAATQFWISSTGKRHKSSCRYFGVGKGKYGGPTDGTPCGICGG